MFSFQVFVPNEVRLFGTAHKTVKKGTSPCGIYMYIQDIYITKSHVKAIDQPTRPCTNEAPSLSTSKCLANFIERKIGRVSPASETCRMRDQ